jgi:large subunit ribosomal protein L5
MAQESKSKGGGKPAGKSDKGKSDKGKSAAAKPEKAKGSKPQRESATGQAPTVAQGRPTAPREKPRLAKMYADKVRPELMKKFGYTSLMQAPRFEKIVINMGVGEAVTDAKLLDAAANDLAIIAGQKPAIRKARKAISNFKLREGLGVGCSVTLRGARMYEFYDRLVHVAVPRIRDFRGLSPRSFDGRGNYSVGLTEQIIFPEINYDRVAKVRGMDVTIVTSARNDEEGRELLRLMQMPFRQR